jgi:putative oxidoreductase
MASMVSAERFVAGRMAGRASKHLRKDLGLLPPRAALGATMLYHGVDKLKREGREGAAQAFESMGIKPGRAWSLATGIAEVGAGALALAGVLTRPAALAVLVTQGMAIAKVHARNGFPVTKGGYEFNLALMAIAAALLVAGPGRFSTHELLEHAVDRRGARAAERLLRRTRGGLLSRLVRLLK